MPFFNKNGLPLGQRPSTKILKKIFRAFGDIFRIKIEIGHCKFVPGCFALLTRVSHLTLRLIFEASDERKGSNPSKNYLSTSAECPKVLITIKIFSTFNLLLHSANSADDGSKRLNSASHRRVPFSFPLLVDELCQKKNNVGLRSVILTGE